MSQRREFLQSTAAARGLLVLKPETVFGAQANSAVEVGIIGCGGRGNYTGAMFPEYAGARIVAVTDPFEDRISETVAKLKASSARTYKGFDGYKELIASKPDAVTII